MTARALREWIVKAWHYDHTIPHRWRYHLAKLAKKKRIKSVPPELQSFMQ